MLGDEAKTVALKDFEILRERKDLKRRRGVIEEKETRGEDIKYM
jgi:hypothetical protein